MSDSGTGIRKCSKCGRLFKIKNAGPEPMSPGGTFPAHLCSKCRDPKPETEPRRSDDFCEHEANNGGCTLPRNHDGRPHRDGTAFREEN